MVSTYTEVLSVLGRQYSSTYTEVLPFRAVKVETFAAIWVLPKSS